MYLVPQFKKSNRFATGGQKIILIYVELFIKNNFTQTKIYALLLTRMKISVLTDDAFDFSCKVEHSIPKISRPQNPSENQLKKDVKKP